MACKKRKWYVVWAGWAPGVYSTWAECKAATDGYSGAKFKSFSSRGLAEQAFRDGPQKHWGACKPRRTLSDGDLAAVGQPVAESLCVDAAWNPKSKEMEYRGVWHHDGALAFHEGPFPNATNNIGEFLAVVDGLRVMVERGLDWPIYSDSRTAMAWVRNIRVRSKSMEKGETSEEVDALVAAALCWLVENEYSNSILKWQTEAWGEVPADFGRKGNRRPEVGRQQVA